MAGKRNPGTGPIAKKAAPTPRKSTAPRTDLTARRKEEQQAALSAEQQAEQQRMSTASVEQQIEDTLAIDDYTGEGVTDQEMEEHGAQVVIEHEVGPEEYVEPVDAIDDRTVPDAEREPDEEIPFEAMVMRPSTEIVIPREDCRFILGAGNEYTFTAGRRAKVKAEVAAHMREKGLVWS